MQCASVTFRSWRRCLGPGPAIDRADGRSRHPTWAALHGAQLSTRKYQLCHAPFFLPPQRLQQPCIARAQAATGPPAGPPSVSWAAGSKAVVLVCAAAMFLVNAHRSYFTMVLPAAQAQMGLSLVEVAQLQSAMLLGYLAGQLPSGWLADAAGGERVLLAGLLLASLATGSYALAPLAPAPLPALLAARAAFGLFSSVAMPGVSAMAARWVPATQKASTLAYIYASWNLGGVAGFIATPCLAAACGWAAGAVATGAAGVALAAAGGLLLPQQGPAAASQPGAPPAASGLQPPELPALGLQTDVAGGQNAAGAPIGTPRGAAGEDITAQQQQPLSRVATLLHVASLCWSHAVIGYGFFILQAWTPLYLSSLGVASAGSTGLLSSLPWLATAVVGACAGQLADGLLRRGLRRLDVRRAMHAVSSLGCAAAIAPLVLSTQPTPALATACLVATTACYAFSFGGFHAYVQDVARGDAGMLLALTNSSSIFMGLLGNLATGYIVAATGAYSTVFVLAAALYVSSFALFFLVLRGQPISLQVLLLPRSSKPLSSSAP